MFWFIVFIILFICSPTAAIVFLIFAAAYALFVGKKK